MKRDYYEVLGVARDAGTDELKKAYRRLAMELHPDRNPGNKEAEEKFKEAAEAYSVLSDPEKRKVYDQFGHAGLGGAGGGGGQQFQFDPRQFADFEDILGSFFGGGLFGDLFGGGRRRANGEERGSDLQYNLRISFKDALFGQDAMELSIPRLEACEACQGSGCEAGSRPETCPQCRGQGQVAVRQGFFQMLAACPRCEGRGRIIPRPCRACSGEGRIHRKTKVSFRIPAGVDRGTRLRLQGQGESGRFGGRSGDLYVVFEVEPDPTYERDGSDLHRRLDVSWPLLVLGGTLKVDTPYGTDQVKVAAGTPADHVVRLVNAGVPRLQGGGRGDLYLHLRAAVPKSLTAEQRELLEQLRRSFEGGTADPEGEEGFLSKVFGGGDRNGKKKKRK
ncbi:MAG TPA: molecular chaperone DnaJ [Holophagaceae bacterium]